MKKIVFFLFLLCLGGGYFLRNEILESIESFYQSFKIKVPDITVEIPKISNKIPQFSQVFAPPPLKIDGEEIGFLTKEGVIYWTNKQRENLGILSLKENELLNQSAQLKLKDMFEKKYFAHESPTGIKIKDLIDKVGYNFILIGENLAMGNFKDDKDLVISWMESEGHRENILNAKYQEIGVAVGQGIFEGKKVWMAVQHFGKPLSACVQPDESLKAQIEENEEKLERLEGALSTIRLEIEKIKPKWNEDWKAKIENYNALVEEYNSLLRETQVLIHQYNNQVKLFNECANQ